MNVFDLRGSLIEDYSSYISSFIRIDDRRIKEHVDQEINNGLLWPDPLIQLNPTFEPGKSIDDLVDESILHKECKRIFRRKQSPENWGTELNLHKHQEDAIRIANKGDNYILTTGTGSGKSLTYIIPIVDYILKRGSGKGVQAIIVYPMNALANSQLGELQKFLNFGYPDGRGPVTFERYTGQENDQERNRILSNPPDIILTNYVMLELILTRPEERNLVRHAQDLRFLVLDELHTYRGRQGADVSMLVRRVREAMHAKNLQCIGTSATLAGAGSFEDQRREVAKVASSIFGDIVHPHNVVGETLRRSTKEFSFSDEASISKLAVCIHNQEYPENFAEFEIHPLASWVESELGLNTDRISGRLIRATPQSLTGENGVGKKLSKQTGLSEASCNKALQNILMKGYSIINPQTGFPVFAFRLHQFISRGDTVYSSIEPSETRNITVHGQKYVPGERDKILLPLAFCRECGQEYYVIRRIKDKESGEEIFIPRELNENRDADGGEAGFLYISQGNPWPDDLIEAIDTSRIPDDWLEENERGFSIKRSMRKNLPEAVHVSSDGKITPTGLKATYLKAPFRFCLHCGVAYGSHQSSDFAKLTELSSGGRSTDTTILSMSLIRRLRNDPNLLPKARKLLSFTDNRQDASLQAGHFNDFVEISLLRSALYKAVKEIGPEGIPHEVLTMKVFQSLNLPLQYYASDPEVRFAQKAETERAMREVLGYRIYRDLKRGWRITSPNLEQSGLLQIEYTSLDELCASEDVWQDTHLALSSASPETRMRISTVLLDFMRRELAIKVSYLDQAAQESLRQLSNQRLIAPWAIDENETLEHSSILFPRRKLSDKDEYGGNIYLSPRSGFGTFLRRSSTFPEYHGNITLDDTKDIIPQLLLCLKKAGLVEIVVDEKNEKSGTPGYQLLASGMIWKAGEGKTAFHDPIRVPVMPESGGRTNEFFVDFYRNLDRSILGIEAREHTAQVPSEQREERETKFRSGTLPILYCSPTMELGVDISELNAVNMRNVPPNPANYAQRSGRAGRSGQPALVFTYCTIGSPHDQYYFKRPQLMVAGAVTPPRIDLTNEDLVRSHVHAIWLAESGLKLGTSLRDLLDLNDPTSLPILDSVQDELNSQSTRSRAKLKAQAALLDIEGELAQTDWWNEGWLDTALSQIDRQFNLACDRWRNLYRAALNQLEVQHKIILDASRSPQDKHQAQRLYQEAQSQMELLTESKNIVQSDFYSYRYFASEGFLPGYSFPRLPLSAYIPARRIRSQNDEFLSRPRFLAISEFGPRSIIYHEGSRYVINKVNLPLSETGEGFATLRAKQCQVCGYLHPITEGDGVDLCENCNAPLEVPLTNLFRLQNVSTKRRDRISSDEEERLRQGFELRTAVRFVTHGGVQSARNAEIHVNDEMIGKMTYGHSATLWRINLGWRRRAKPKLYGFILDTERGYWARKEDDQANKEAEDPMSPRTMRVIPFVEDHKNCLIFEPTAGLELEQMASLQAALKNAIQVEYQLEDNELSAEPLPSYDERHSILFFESAEGGAGVLRRLVDDPGAFARVASTALTLCHFDAHTGEDLRHAPHAKEDCEAACYDCLMSYFNQLDHRLLDRQNIKDYLLLCSNAMVQSSPTPDSRKAHFEKLINLCQSDLERKWLTFIFEQNYALPTHAQYLIETCQTRPDFYYQENLVAIYIDGPHHLYPERKNRDLIQTECMEDFGITVIRFSHAEEWKSVIDRYPSPFGKSPQ